MGKKKKNSREGRGNIITIVIISVRQKAFYPTPKPHRPRRKNAVPYLDLLHPRVPDAVQGKAVPHAGVKAMVS